jgi:hypothetical protein
MFDLFEDLSAKNLIMLADTETINTWLKSFCLRNAMFY